MGAGWLRCALLILEGMLAELIWLRPETAAFFRTFVAERVAERVAEDAPEDVVHAVPRAA